jgi:tetratricopeptide (TPR) repeat protein
LELKVGYLGLRAGRAAQRDGKSARRAVTEVMALPWPQVEKQWHAHLKVGDGKARAGHPIKFGKGGAESENVGIETVAPRARKYARLGGMLRARGMLQAAVAEYEKALAAAGGDRAAADQPFVAGKLARTLVELGRFDRAIELATPLAAADDRDAVAAVTLGIAHAARHQWPEAIAAYEQALRVSPFDPQTRCGLAEAYSQTKDPRAARERSACEQLKQ